MPRSSGRTERIRPLASRLSPLASLLLLSLLIKLPGSLSANTYTTCTKQADCTDSSRPICKIWWSDRMYSTSANGLADLMKPVEVKGVCVECINDCDCPVGKHCSHDYALPSFTPTNLQTDLSKKINLYSQAYAGLKIRSICRSYDQSTNTETCAYSSYLSGDPITTASYPVLPSST